MEKISMDFLEGISIIPENVGKNIKEIRTRQMDNVSVRTIVERMTQLGYPISAKNYYKWESGETAVPSCAIIYLAEALQCSVYQITHQRNMKEKRIPPGADFNEHVVQHLASIYGISEEAVEIMSYAAHEWAGSEKALVHFIRMYISMDKSCRHEAISGLFMVYEHAQAQHQIDPGAPAPDVEVVKRAWLQLKGR